jgi:hypothetical protein
LPRSNTDVERGSSVGRAGVRAPYFQGALLTKKIPCGERPTGTVLTT